MTENKRFTVPLRYSLSHSKIQYDGIPLTNDELVRILNTNDGVFLEYFKLKEEHKELKEENEQLKQKISELKCLLELAKLHTEVAEGKMDKFVELKLND